MAPRHAAHFPIRRRHTDRAAESPTSLLPARCGRIPRHRLARSRRIRRAAARANSRKDKRKRCSSSSPGLTEQRPNAFKNLGLALEGLGRYQDAGHCYVRATQANASDGRSFVHLQHMIKRHPELEFEFQTELINCQKAVQLAAEATRRARNEKPNPPA